MIHCLKFILLLQLSSSIISSQPFDGLTLISKEDGDSSGPALTQLIDNNENIINEWFHDTDLSGIAYLTSDSLLFVSCKINNPNGPNRNGRFKKMNWEGEIIWDFILSEEICRPHHDIEILPNGNILIICSELKTYEELSNAGMVIEEVPDININRGNMDMVIEIEPLDNDLANIVWKWHFWDHLIQDINPDLPNYGSISDNPQLLNINSLSFSFEDIDHLPGADANDWMHCNSISYNAILNQIVLSSRHRSEFYVIDHSTTIEEASIHSGGDFGKGGDFLYRWGNPQNYGRGDVNDQILKGQHSVVWIPENFPGDGNFLLFNNFHTIDYSAVLEIIPPINQDGSYFIDSINAYGPINYDWIYELGHVAAVRGGVWRLPNGNTIITTFSELFEIHANSEIEWVYNGSLLPSRVIKYSFDYFNSNNDLLYDLNNDGVVNNSDFTILISLVVNENNSVNAADINNDLLVDIFDLLLLSDYIQDM